MATKKDTAPAEEIRTLRDQLNDWSHRYYVLDDPSVPDAEYDRAFRRLEEELPPLFGLEEPSVSSEVRRSTLRDAADQLNNSMCLVEAVSVSPRYWLYRSCRLGR